MTALVPVGPAGLITSGGDRAGHVEHLAQGDARLCLRSDAPAVGLAAVADLHAYRPAAARPAAAHGDGWTLTVRTTASVDTARAAALCTGPAVDVGPGQHAHPYALPGGLLWWIPETKTLVHRDDRRREVTAFCPTVAHGRSWAVRLARQLMTVQLVHAGAVHAHAAAFTCRGDTGGVLVSGAAGAGKTTCLLLGLRAARGRFVANDRVLLAPDPDGVLAYAWPAPLRAAAGTLRALDELAALVPAAPGRRGDEAKLDIDPARLAPHFGTGTTGSTRPRLMLWPVRDHRARRPETVSPDEVRITLLDTCLFLREPATGRSSHLNHWLVPLPSPADLDRARRAVVDRLAATVPCVRMPVTDDVDRLVRHLRDALTIAGDPGAMPEQRERW